MVRRRSTLYEDSRKIEQIFGDMYTDRVVDARMDDFGFYFFAEGGKYHSRVSGLDIFHVEGRKRNFAEFGYSIERIGNFPYSTNVFATVEMPAKDYKSGVMTIPLHGTGKAKIRSKIRKAVIHAVPGDPPPMYSIHSDSDRPGKSKGKRRSKSY